MQRQKKSALVFRLNLTASVPNWMQSALITMLSVRNLMRSAQSWRKSVRSLANTRRRKFVRRTWLLSTSMPSASAMKRLRNLKSLLKPAPVKKWTMLLLSAPWNSLNLPRRTNLSSLMASPALTLVLLQPIAMIATSLRLLRSTTLLYAN